jgi:hypothetical protein
MFPARADWPRPAPLSEPEAADRRDQGAPHAPAQITQAGRGQAGQAHGLAHDAKVHHGHAPESVAAGRASQERPIGADEAIATIRAGTARHMVSARCSRFGAFLHGFQRSVGSAAAGAGMARRIRSGRAQRRSINSAAS